MPNYVLVYEGGRMSESEEEGQAVMAAWGKWYADLGEALVDGGNPFGPSASIASDGSVSQGAPSSLTGFTVIAADSLDAATDRSRAARIWTRAAGWMSTRRFTFCS